MLQLFPLQRIHPYSYPRSLISLAIAHHPSSFFLLLCTKRENFYSSGIRDFQTGMVCVLRQQVPHVIFFPSPKPQLLVHLEGARKHSKLVGPSKIQEEILLWRSLITPRSDPLCLPKSRTKVFSSIEKLLLPFVSCPHLELSLPFFVNSANRPIRVFFPTHERTLNGRAQYQYHVFNNPKVSIWEANKFV